MDKHWVVWEPWCPNAYIGDGGYFIPHMPELVSVVKAVDEIIYRMMQP